MKFKAVIFDLDGTLINTIEDLANATNYMLRNFNYPTHEVKAYKMMVGNGMKKLVQRALPEEKRQEPHLTECLNIFLDYYNLHSTDKTVAYDGMIATIEKIKAAGFKIGVVTNKAEGSAKAILAKLYPDVFDVIVGQREEFPTKPDPSSTLYAMKVLQVKPNECLFVGDSGVDIQTAVNSGAYPVGVLWGFRDETELVKNGAKKTISYPEQLLELLGLKK